jgi:hypothetical protein
VEKYYCYQYLNDRKRYKIYYGIFRTLQSGVVVYFVINVIQIRCRDDTADGNNNRNDCESNENCCYDARNIHFHSLLPHPQRGDEGFLGNAYIPILPHPRLALLLLVQQLLLARNVAAIAFRRHVLAHRRDGLAGDYLAADRGLDGDFEQVAGDQVFQALAHAAASGLCGAAVDDHAQRIDRVAVDEDAHLHKVAFAVADLVVIERRIAARYAL